ncbi:Nucleotidyltransferase domain protein [Candidatus Magnetomorum sp. HK-1]|nr:Nucleotidyltransferase domain protein [Candidatus Magnetomorum sp. HK-1]
MFIKKKGFFQPTIKDETAMKKLNDKILKKSERSAIYESIAFLKQSHQLDSVILYGSKARGDFDEYSDIDLLIITFYKLKNKEESHIYEVLFDIGIKYDVIFSPLNIVSKDWRGGIFTEFYIYNEILKDGIVCYESTNNKYNLIYK